MGLFTGLKAMKAVKQIKNGGKAKLSYAMVSMLIINLQDAKAKLPPEKFAAVEKQFMDFQKCDTLFEVDKEGYLELCNDVIKKFDAIAPYEKYSGGNELEFSMLMDDVRKEESKKKELIDKAFSDSFDVDEKFVKALLAECPMATRQDAVEFYNIVMVSKVRGKQVALKRFDNFVENKAKGSLQDAMMVVPYLCGSLYPCGVITQAESNDLGKKYSNKLIDMMIKSNQ